MNLTVGNLKGGCGKSTLACNLAIFLAHLDGEGSTLGIDADRQRSMSSFSQFRHKLKEQGRIQSGLFECIHVEGKSIEEVLRRLGPKYKNIVIDVGGQDNIAMRVAMLNSDKLLVPVEPRAFDVMALKFMAQVIKRAQQHNSELEVISVLNRAYSGGDANKQAYELIRTGLPALNILPTFIKTRIAWPNSSGFGYSITDKIYRDSKAIAEYWDLLKGMGFETEQIKKGLV